MEKIRDQYGTSKTCGDPTTDLCYGHTPEAYNSKAMPSI